MAFNQDMFDKPISFRQDFPLHYLAKVGHFEELGGFLELDPVSSAKQIGRVDSQGRTILHYAAMGANLAGGAKCVEVILNFLNELRGEDKELFLTTGITRLSNRIRKHHYWKSESCQETIDCINVRDISGETALHIAAKNENTKIVEALMTHSANVLAVSNNGEQALTLIYTKTPSAVTALLHRSVFFDHGIEADSFDSSERRYCLDFTAVIGDTSETVKGIEDEILLTQQKQGSRLLMVKKRRHLIYEEAYCLYKIEVDDSNAETYKGVLTHPLIRFFVDGKIRKLRWVIYSAIFLKLLWVGLYIWHIVEVYYNCCELGSNASNFSVTCAQFPFGPEDVKLANWTQEDGNLIHNSVLNCARENNSVGRTVSVTLLSVYVLLTIVFKYAILSSEYLKIQNCFLWIFTIFLIITMHPMDKAFKTQYQFSAFGILLSFLVVLELIHKHVYWAIYIRVLITVIRRLLATLPLFVFIMGGFSISMRMMFPNINPPVTDFRDAMMEVFSAIANGKVEWTEGRRYKEGVDDNFQLSGLIMFLVFYVSMILLLFRVLIGFVVADTKKIQEREELNEISQDLKEIFLFESLTTSKGFQWLSSFKCFHCLIVLRGKFMLCPQNKMQLWISESEMPKHLRKPMRILASKNPPKFRSQEDDDDEDDLREIRKVEELNGGGAYSMQLLQCKKKTYHKTKSGVD